MDAGLLICGMEIWKSLVHRSDVAFSEARRVYSLGEEKARFHEPTNHDDERNKTADEWKLTKKQ